MVSSIDGAAQGPDARSGTLSTPTDQRVFALLRALADVVLVGAGTARAESYGPAEPDTVYATLRERDGRPPAAPMAVVSRRLELHPSSPLFTRALDVTGAAQRTIVLTVESAPPERRSALAEVADVIVAGEKDVDPSAALSQLAERGLRRVLCEGGPSLLAEVARAGRLDELCYTVTPMLAGGYATRILDGAPIHDSRWQLAHLLEDDGALLTRWLHSPVMRQSERTDAMS
ncbi:pyrimidine reductase family protein [Phytoactinopolyspora alkaliphila]|uniref:Pyrimidine reductase family protein n=2 Tax=Phytoactinopolyspora alkaliphila TaxID=1783498 RepID=A0A6N9YGS5_9ACTN|nr:dihydrofolate reductase family protein [Phytoactinopolyspora alkaliphila]NED94130.1 pyrimidine reductase family protein [Phytoactinopolyspora alkaliphila]